MKPPADTSTESVPLEKTERTHPVWQRVQDGLVALSLANLCFLTASFRLLHSKDHGYFNALSPAPPALLALVANILWLALAVWLVIRARRRVPGRLFRLAADICFFLLLLLPVDFCRRMVFDIPDYAVVSFLKRPLTIAAGLVLAVVLVWQHRRIARVAAIVVGLLSPLALFGLARIGLMSFGLPGSGPPGPEPAPPPTVPFRADQPRIVWIIFDEMDRRLSFDERPPGLSLPAFDRLRAESLDATNAYPPGDSTLISMPSLISGRRVSTVEICSRSDLMLTFADTGATTNWSEFPSVFSTARGLGVNTALVGWYHPYSRLLGANLNYCSWYPFPQSEPARAQTFGGSMVRELSCLGGPVYLRQLYVDLCRASLRDSLSVVTNAAYGLILLHLPPPHRPGVYRPDQDQYTAFGVPKTTGYFNNLALADRWLAQLRAALDAAGESGRTWLVVSADHSWRESMVYDGKRDLRVPFLVRPPDARARLACPTQINTVITHDLVLAILRREVTEPQTALAWLSARGSTELPVTISRGD